MKRITLLPLLLLLGFASGTAAASPKNGASSQKRVIPVLLNINAKGQVTEVVPGYKLHPKFSHFLRGQLKKIAVKPASEKGRKVSSQYLLVLALDTESRDNGKYDVNIKFLSGKPLPQGPWHWVHGTNHQLALSSPTQERFTLSGPSWTQKMQEFNNLMGFHASDPLMR